MKKQFCWQPVVIKDSNNLNTLESKYFGNTWIKSLTDWPTFENEPGLFVFQLDIKTLPEKIAKLLGNNGLFQFFVKPSGYSDNLKDILLARVVEPVDGLYMSVESKEYLSNETTSVEQKIITGWIEHEDQFHNEDQFFEEDEDENEDNDLCVQGDKLSGCPFWYQGDEHPGKSYELIFQLDMGSQFDGVAFDCHAPSLLSSEGTIHIFVSKKNPKKFAYAYAC
jgi:hypothetical protein